jgi:hypothetical protein
MDPKIMTFSHMIEPERRSWTPFLCALACDTDRITVDGFANGFRCLSESAQTIDYKNIFTIQKEPHTFFMTSENTQAY